MRFAMLADTVDPETGLPERYRFLDWIFEDETELDALIYLEQRPVHPEDDQRFFPFGLVIMNPYLRDKHELIREAFSSRAEICGVQIGISRPE
jgi:hypothetical protein